MAKVIFEFNTVRDDSSEEGSVKSIVRSGVTFALGEDEEESPAVFMAELLFISNKDVFDLLEHKAQEIPNTSLKEVARSPVVDIPESEHTVH